MAGGWFLVLVCDLPLLNTPPPPTLLLLGSLKKREYTWEEGIPVENRPKQTFKRGICSEFRKAGLSAYKWTNACSLSSYCPACFWEALWEQNKSLRKKEQSAVFPVSWRLLTQWCVPIWQIGSMTAAHTNIYAEIIQPWVTWIISIWGYEIHRLLSERYCYVLKKISFYSSVPTKHPEMLKWAGYSAVMILMSIDHLHPRKRAVTCYTLKTHTGMDGRIR